MLSCMAVCHLCYMHLSFICVLQCCSFLSLFKHFLKNVIGILLYCLLVFDSLLINYEQNTWLGERKKQFRLIMGNSFTVIKCWSKTSGSIKLLVAPLVSVMHYKVEKQCTSILLSKHLKLISHVVLLAWGYWQNKVGSDIWIHYAAILTDKHKHHFYDFWCVNAITSSKKQTLGYKLITSQTHDFKVTTTNLLTTLYYTHFKGHIQYFAHHFISSYY